MATFIAQAKNGGIHFSDYTHKLFTDYLKKNEGARLEIKTVLPESRSMRKFYHGAVLPMWCYLDGGDYRNGDILEQYHEVAKQEFLPRMVVVDGKRYKIGSSTKNSLKLIIERLIEYLEENYGIDRGKVLNPDHYKEFRDTIFMDGKYDDYISYLIELRYLENKKFIKPIWRKK